MGTGISAPRALVLICARTTCFAKTGLVGGGECVRGPSGVRQVVVCHHCRGANSVPAANQRSLVTKSLQLKQRQKE